MTQSTLYRWSPDDTSIDEKWHSLDFVDPAKKHYLLVSIHVHICKNHQEAIEGAQAVYLARMDADPSRDLPPDMPILGSYTGRPIGDICWHYRPSEATESDWFSDSLILVQGSYLANVRMTNAASPVTQGQIEEMALKVAGALATRKNKNLSQ